MKLNHFLTVIPVLFCIAFLSCKTNQDSDSNPLLQQTRLQLADHAATNETVALFYNLGKLAHTNVLFGHQDDTKNGFGWTYNELFAASYGSRSDVHSVTGAFPAVYGWDFMAVTNFDTTNWLSTEQNSIRRLAIEAYQRGGINTFSWHYENPISQGGSHWNSSPVEAVSRILPGGDHHASLKTALQKIARYSRTLSPGSGKLIPVIFRPFHEMDGDWFWWGKTHCTVAQYKELYRFTVSYLRDSLGVHNFLYAWSPDRNFHSEGEYLTFYPGDDVVDVIGIDNYWDLIPGVPPEVAGNKLKIVSDVAAKKKKIAAFTETGLPNITQANWYTGTLQKLLQQPSLQLAFVLVWSNSTDMYWTPHKGHPAENDFLQFKNQSSVLFGDRLPNMYRIRE